MVNVLLNYYNFDEDWAFQHLSKYISPLKKVTVLPLAFRDNQAWNDKSWQALYSPTGEKYSKIVAPFLRYGLAEKQITFINYFTYTASMKHTIEQSDVLLLTGGLPEKILQRLDILSLTDTIKNFKGVLLGASAGAMVQLDNYHITPDEDYPSYRPHNAGLGLVSGFDLEVHFENTQIQRQCLRQAIADNKKAVFAIWHESGIIVEENIITTMGKVDVFGRLDEKFTLL